MELNQLAYTVEFEQGIAKCYVSIEMCGTYKSQLLSACLYTHSLVPRPLFFLLCGGGEKKGSGGSPMVFLCSQIYNFWGLLIGGQLQQTK